MFGVFWVWLKSMPWVVLQPARSIAFGFIQPTIILITQEKQPTKSTSQCGCPSYGYHAMALLSTNPPNQTMILLSVGGKYHAMGLFFIQPSKSSHSFNPPLVLAHN